MKNMLIIVIALAIGWFTWQMLKPAASKPDNTVTRYADTLSKSTDKAEDAKNLANRTTVKSAVTMFKSKEGRLPSGLNELVEKGYLHSVPRGIDYNPQTGEVK